MNFHVVVGFPFHSVNLYEGGRERERDALGHDEKLFVIGRRLGNGFEEGFDDSAVGKDRVLFLGLMCDGRVVGLKAVTSPYSVRFAVFGKVFQS